MLQVLGVVLNGAEVRRSRENVPNKIEVNVNIDKVVPQDTPDSVLLEFTYAVDYHPDVAKVRIYGNALCKDTPANIKRLLAEHKKTKIVPMDLGASAINMINANAGLNMIFLIRPFNLLPHFMPPLIATEVKAQESQATKKKQ